MTSTNNQQNEYKYQDATIPTSSFNLYFGLVQQKKVVIMLIIDHLKASSSDGVDEKDSKEKAERAIKELSLSKFFDWNQPWVLIPGGSYQGYFDFLPRYVRCGPGSTIAISSVKVISLAMAIAGIEIHKQGGILVLFRGNIRHNYVAFDRDWYITLAGFVWLLFLCWYVYAHGPKGKAAWATFTLWSWTVMTIRHGLCLLAPFVPSVRLISEILRFPALLSATLVCFIWNLVLFPVILLFIKDPEKRSKFLSHMTSFRLTQLHVFNIVYAGINGAFVEPRRTLHMGDLASAVIFLTCYMLWYYCVLDRLGVHIYPIFSLRTAWSSVSFALLIALCYVGFHGWNRILSL